MTAAAILHDTGIIARLGDIVELDHKPAGVGGRSFRDLRYRLVRVDTISAWVFGPLTEVDGHWLPMPGRVVREYRADLDTIIGGAG